MYKVSCTFKQNDGLELTHITSGFESFGDADMQYCEYYDSCRKDLFDGKITSFNVRFEEYE